MMRRHWSYSSRGWSSCERMNRCALSRICRCVDVYIMAETTSRKLAGVYGMDFRFTSTVYTVFGKSLPYTDPQTSKGYDVHAYCS